MDVSVPSKYEGLRAVQYAQEVVQGKTIAGKYIILECARFLKDLNRIEDEDFQWDFDVNIYNVIIGFQDFFKFADGIMAGKPMKLAKFQEWILGNLFCWVHKEDRYVRFTKAYIQVARKQGKSMLLGYMGFIKSLLEEYSQIYCCATKKDQSAIVIKEIKKMLDKAIPSVKERFTVYGKASIAKIVCEITKSELAPLSSDANTLDGLGMDLAIIDEFGAHPSYELYEVCRSSQTYKVNSQIVAITTAYPNINTSPAYQERCILVDAYEGKTEMDDRYFSAIYELDLKDGDEYTDESVWGKANPLFVEFPAIMAKLKSDFENALKNPQKLQLFLTKNLNCWLASDALTAYIDYEEWIQTQEDFIDFRGLDVVVGLDLSKSTDLTGVAIVGRNEDGEYLVKAKAFLPKDVLNIKEVSDKLPYSSYLEKKDKDWLQVTEGKFVNQTDVENFVRRIELKLGCRIKSIAFDSWGALHLMSSLSSDYDVVDVKMTYKNFSPPIKKFRELVYAGKVRHEFNPILNFCVANAVTKQDLQENILLDKKRSPNRIDLLVATIIAFSEWFYEEDEDGVGYFMV